MNEPLTWESAPEILTVPEVAALLRIPRTAAYAAIQAGLLPAANFGSRRIRVSKAVLAKVFGIEAPDSPSTAAFGHRKA